MVKFFVQLRSYNRLIFEPHKSNTWIHRLERRVRDRCSSRVYTDISKVPAPAKSVKLKTRQSFFCQVIVRLQKSYIRFRAFAYEIYDYFCAIRVRI